MAIVHYTLPMLPVLSYQQRRAQVVGLILAIMLLPHGRLTWANMPQQEHAPTAEQLHREWLPQYIETTRMVWENVLGARAATALLFCFFCFFRFFCFFCFFCSCRAVSLRRSFAPRPF